MALLSVTASPRASRTRPRSWRWLFAGAAMLLAGWTAAAAPVVTQEYKVKAVFLFNFTQFVDWPPEAFAEPNAPFVIGVLGNDPFDGVLDDVVRGEKAQARALVVNRYRQIEDVGACHVLFIGQTDSARLRTILAGLRGRSILTVGDTEGFATAGGMICFFNDHNRIRLRINVDAARAANLRISSKLLRPAEIVGSGKEGN